MSAAATHVRQHNSFLAAAEKRLLIRIASRLPRWVSSDHLSALGLGCMALAGLSLSAIGRTPAAGVWTILALAGNWLGDSLDGTVARVRNQQRPRYGFYVDHVIDIAGTTFLVGGLALSGVMSPVIALAVLAGFLLMCAESYLSTAAGGAFRISFGGFGPTELRIVLAVGIVRLMQSPWIDAPLIGRQRLFDAGGAVAAAGMAVVFAIAAARQTRALYLAEPLCPPASARS